MARSAPRPKWGAGSFSAWMRQGLKELRAALYPDSPIARALRQVEVALNRTAEGDAPARRVALAGRPSSIGGWVIMSVRSAINTIHHEITPVMKLVSQAFGGDAADDGHLRITHAWQTQVHRRVPGRPQAAGP